MLSLEESVKLMGVADNYQEEIERIRQMKEASATSIYEDAKTNLSTKKDENSSINTTKVLPTGDNYGYYTSI